MKIAVKYVGETIAEEGFEACRPAHQKGHMGKMIFKFTCFIDHNTPSFSANHRLDGSLNPIHFTAELPYHS